MISGVAILKLLENGKGTVSSRLGKQIAARVLNGETQILPICKKTSGTPRLTGFSLWLGPLAPGISNERKGVDYANRKIPNALLVKER